MGRNIAVAGIIAAVVPFLVSVKTSSSVSMSYTDSQGVVHEARHEESKDFVALGFGALGLVLSVAALLSSLRSAKARAARSLVAIGFALGVLQVLRGVGLLS